MTALRWLTVRAEAIDVGGTPCRSFCNPPTPPFHPWQTSGTEKPIKTEKTLASIQRNPSWRCIDVYTLFAAYGGRGWLPADLILDASSEVWPRSCDPPSPRWGSARLGLSALVSLSTSLPPSWAISQHAPRTSSPTGSTPLALVTPKNGRSLTRLGCLRRWCYERPPYP